MHYLYRLLWNRSIAEELTQEVFLRVFRAANTYKPKTSFRTWIFQIATNLARNERRRAEYSVQRIPLSANARRWDEARQEERHDPTAEDPEVMTEARRMEEMVQQILSELPERQRAALILCRVHGMPYREIAEILQLRVGAVKSLIHRATVTLRRGVAPFIPGDEREGA